MNHSAKRLWPWLVTLFGVVCLAFGLWALYPWSLYIGGPVALAIAAVAVRARKPIVEFWSLRRQVPNIMRVTEETARKCAADLARRWPALPPGGGGDIWSGWKPHLDTFVASEIVPRLSPRERDLLADRPAVRKEVDDAIINIVLLRLREGA